MDKTLYVSDLDGTLLRSDQTVSAYTSGVINRLVDQGMIFSYATARSHETASKITEAITARIPVIVYNGAFILDSYTREILHSNYFEEGECREIFKALRAREVLPIVYAHRDGAEKFSYLEKGGSVGMRDFLLSRSGDSRANPVESLWDLQDGRVFYFTCIDGVQKLSPLYDQLKDTYYCVYQRDIYSGEQWLEIMPRRASKANAARRLAQMTGCSRLIAFGDGRNDIPLFEIADECYAVENADPALKRMATGVIAKNDEDAVAKWLVNSASSRMGRMPL